MSIVCRECAERIKARRTEPDHVPATNYYKEQRMSIGAIGGLTAAATAINALGRPESAEVRGAPEHDADSDNGGAKAVSGATAVASLAVKSTDGHIDVKA
ncbi:MAG TPA: hypothetical protein VK252_08190 [Solirubrobacteraceae bacterium]|nr:hypothetical protein [Solirubrobacteraceae bacterium]